MVFVETTRRKLHRLSLLLFIPLAPFVALMVASVLHYDEAQAKSMMIITPIAASCMVFAAMMWMTRRPVFDRERNEYFCQRTAKRVNDVTPLERIRALQLLETEFDGQLELNLVLDDGSRRNVITHGDHPPLAKEADRLATWLGVPVLAKPSP
jgi:hypothetical protein